MHSGLHFHTFSSCPLGSSSNRYLPRRRASSYPGVLWECAKFPSHSLRFPNSVLFCMPRLPSPGNTCNTVTLRTSTNSVFPGLKTTFNSVVCAIIWRRISLKCQKTNFTFIGDVCEQPKLDLSVMATFHLRSPEERHSSGLPLAIVRIALCSFENSAVAIWSYWKLSDLQLAYNIMLLGENQGGFQLFSEHLNDITIMSYMSFTSLKCGILL